MNEISIQPITIKTNLQGNINTINTINPIFKNETVFIIGGGPSLIGFDFKRLSGKNVIAINKAIFSMPFYDNVVAYFSDYRFYQWYINELKSIKCTKYTIGLKVPKEDAITLKNSGKFGFDLRNGYIRNGGNSGYAAINLAIHLGVNRIVLLGYDMVKVNNETHFHGGYSDKNECVKQTTQIYQKFSEPFAGITDFMQTHGIEIYNTSNISTLNIRKAKIENFL